MIARRAATGFILIELLLVLVVIAILAGGFFSKNGGANNQSTYQMSMSRSKDAACKANRAVLRTTIEMFKINHPNEPITTENLQKAGLSVPTCPDGGAYGWTAESTLICTKHPD